MIETKAALRASVLENTKFTDQQRSFSGKVAEKLRGDKAYRAAAFVFASPAPILHQIRINCLLDGKNLIMPSPGLKSGFYLLGKNTLSFMDIDYAVSIKGLAKHGKALKLDSLAGLTINLLFTDALAVDASGIFLGDGLGFFDLSYAILSSLGTIGREAKVFAVKETINLLGARIPNDLWDIRVDRLITPLGEQVFADVDRGDSPIFWDALPRNRVRKITPLWELSNRLPG